MSGLAVLCPGQGSQHPELLAFAAASPAGAEVLRRAGAAAGLDLAAVARAGGPALFRNAIAQPLLCAVELATWAALRDVVPAPRLFAGYSLGELAAWGCAGALEPEALADLAVRRAALMDAAGSARPGGLLALRGLPLARAEALAGGAGGAVAIVNGPDHVVVGAPRLALEELERAAGAAGARVQRLCVDVAAHTPALAGAVAPFAAALETSPLRAPAAPVLAGISGEPVRERAAAVTALSRQLAERVRWDRCLAAAVELGCTVLLELGPGSALSRMAAEALPGIETRSVADFRTLDGVRRWVEARLAR